VILAYNQDNCDAGSPKSAKLYIEISSIVKNYTRNETQRETMRASKEF